MVFDEFNWRSKGPLRHLIRKKFRYVLMPATKREATNQIRPMCSWETSNSWITRDLEYFCGRYFHICMSFFLFLNKTIIFLFPKAKAFFGFIFLWSNIKSKGFCVGIIRVCVYPSNKL